MDDREVRERIAAAVYARAEAIASKAVRLYSANSSTGRSLPRDVLFILPSTGLASMTVLLAAALWLTLVGANYPSELLARLFSWGQQPLGALLNHLGAPPRLYEFLILGVYRSAAWVVAVMLPPMAIFFPAFALLEDLGYLPRVAFALDRAFCKAGTQGKQALTMCTGLGCNATGVACCRIIDSPRERLIATLTNVFIPTS